MSSAARRGKMLYGLHEQSLQDRPFAGGTGLHQDNAEDVLMDKLTEEEIKALRALAKDLETLQVMAENDRRISWAKALVKGFLWWIATIAGATVITFTAWGVITKGTVK